MSVGEFENYNETSKDYDSGRQPAGLEIFLGAIGQLMKGELKKATLVDVGCGTGNYAAALSSYVGQITGVEYNAGMFEKASKKIDGLSNVKVIRGDATDIPLPDGCCDVVYCTQVIHHLPMEATGEFTGVKKFIKESYRILKEQGMLIINTSSPEQTQKCWIGTGLAPEAGKRAAARFPPIDFLISELEQTGYKMQSIYLQTFPTLHKAEVTCNPDGPLSAEWRATESAWSHCPPEELERVQEEWRKRQKEGTIQEHFEQRMKNLRQLGETTTLIALK